MTLKQRSDVRNLSDWGVSPVGAYEAELATNRPDVRFCYRTSIQSKDGAKKAAEGWLSQHNVGHLFSYQTPDDVHDSKRSTVYQYFHVKGVQG